MAKPPDRWDDEDTREAVQVANRIIGCFIIGLVAILAAFLIAVYWVTH